MSQSQIFALTQAILAVIITVGGGFLLAFSSVDPALIVGVIGVVVGYFFGSAISPVARGVNGGSGIGKQKG